MGVGPDWVATGSALSTDSNQTTSQLAALSEDSHTQSSFGPAQTPLLFNESMEFTAVGTSIDVDTIIDASDSDASQDGDTEVSEDKILEILREFRDVAQSWLLRLEQHAYADIIKQVDDFVVRTTLFLLCKGEPLIPRKLPPSAQTQPTTRRISEKYLGIPQQFFLDFGRDCAANTPLKKKRSCASRSCTGTFRQHVDRDAHSTCVLSKKLSIDL